MRWVLIIGIALLAAVVVSSPFWYLHYLGSRAALRKQERLDALEIERAEEQHWNDYLNRKDES